MTNEYTIPSEDFCNELLHQSEIDSMSPEELDSTIDLITSKLAEFSSALPKAKFKRHVRPFWNGALTVLKQVKIYAYRIWVDEGRPRDPLYISWVNYKKTKKEFRSELKRVQRDYEQKQIQDLAQSAECDRNKFRRLVKNARQTKESSTLAIKNRQGIVINDIEDVVEAWRDHFSHLSLKKR